MLFLVYITLFVLSKLVDQITRHLINPPNRRCYMHTIMIARACWTKLCELSRSLTSGSRGVYFDPNLVYMASHPFGLVQRSVQVSRSPAHIAPNRFGGWKGYGQNGSQKFVWGSVSQKASIEAYKEKDGTWRLIYRDQPGLSRYLLYFALAAEAGSVRLLYVPDHAQVVEKIARSWNTLSEGARDQLAELVTNMDLRLTVEEVRRYWRIFDQHMRLWAGY